MNDLEVVVRKDIESLRKAISVAWGELPLTNISREDRQRIRSGIKAEVENLSLLIDRHESFSPRR